MRLIKANHLKKGFNFTKVEVNGLANYLVMGHYWCFATSMQGYTLGLLLKSIGWANIFSSPHCSPESAHQMLFLTQQKQCDANSACSDAICFSEAVLVHPNDYV